MLSARGKPDATGYAPIVPDDLPAGGEYENIIDAVRKNEIVAGKFLSADGELALVILALDRAVVAEQGAKPVIDGIRKIFEQHLSAVGLKTQLTGAPVMQLEIRNAVERDRMLYNGLGFLVGAGIAFLFFRRLSLTLIAALGPAIAILWTLGVIGGIDYRLNLFINVLAPLILVSGFSEFNGSRALDPARYSGRHRSTDRGTQCRARRGPRLPADRHKSGLGDRIVRVGEIGAGANIRHCSADCCGSLVHSRCCRRANAGSATDPGGDRPQAGRAQGAWSRDTGTVQRCDRTRRHAFACDLLDSRRSCRLHHRSRLHATRIALSAGLSSAGSRAGASGNRPPRSEADGSQPSPRDDPMAGPRTIRSSHAGRDRRGASRAGESRRPRQTCGRWSRCVAGSQTPAIRGSRRCRNT